MGAAEVCVMADEIRLKVGEWYRDMRTLDLLHIAASTALTDGTELVIVEREGQEISGSRELHPAMADPAVLRHIIGTAAEAWLVWRDARRMGVTMPHFGREPVDREDLSALASVVRAKAASYAALAERAERLANA